MTSETQSCDRHAHNITAFGAFSMSIVRAVKPFDCSRYLWLRGTLQSAVEVYWVKPAHSTGKRAQGYAKEDEGQAEDKQMALAPEVEPDGALPLAPELVHRRRRRGRAHIGPRM